MKIRCRHIAFPLLLAAGLLAVVSILPCPVALAVNSYNPSLDYKGPYTSQWLYFKVGQQWLHAGNGGGSSSFTVKCPEAGWHLQKYGFWLGSLKIDGSCGLNGAPIRAWAVGKWLNYLQSIRSD